jgi:DNA-binding MarR family transcriptional regulator
MLMTTAGTSTTAERLRPLLLRLARRLRREVEHGLTAGQVSILVSIRHSPGVGLCELAGVEGMSAPALSGYVDRLERAGLVRRVRSDTDRRRVGLEATAEGVRVLDAVRERRTEWLAERLGRLEPAELEAVERALGALERLLDERA